MMFLDEQNDYYLLYLSKSDYLSQKSTISHNHRVAILNNTLNCGLMLIMI